LASCQSKKETEWQVYGGNNVLLSVKLCVLCTSVLKKHF
jgi:hypothetical protein